MATASHVELHHDVATCFRVPDVSPESAVRVSELLQQNHDKHDLVFNDMGFHTNITTYHISHHMFTNFALGAQPNALQKAFDINAEYQRPPPKLDVDLVAQLKDPEVFLSNMGKTEMSRTYMAFFEHEISQKGYEAVLKQYLFKGDEVASLMFNRAFASFYHPLIHLGFGLEFKQPTMIAEMLAEVPFHPGYTDAFHNESDRKAKENNPSSECLFSLIDQIKQDKELLQSVEWADSNKIREGLLKRGLDRMTDYQSHFRVKEEDLDERLAELTNAAAYMAGAAQRPDKEVKFDFYLMHSVNSTIFFHEFLKQDWINSADKVKLLEWRGRTDMMAYVSRGSPTLRLKEIVNYKPKHPEQGWPALFERATEMRDDGHVCKLVRAFAHGQKACAPYEDRDYMKVKGDMWLKLGHMALDSTEGASTRWVRDVGFDQAWEHIAARS